MRRLMKVVLVAAVFAATVIPTHQAQGQTNISQFQQFGPTQTVLYLPFYVAVGGTFNLQTFGINSIDPMIWLFTGAAWNGSDLGTALGYNDDGGSPSGSWYNARMVRGLGPGFYTVAMSVYYFDEAEARAGVAGFNDLSTYCDDNGWTTCNYTMGITSETGVAGVVPEPISMVLLGSGLAGLGGVGALRRRRTQLPEA